MKPRNLILFVLLIISTSLIAQKRVQRPRPVKQPAQNVEIQTNAVSVTVSSRTKGNSTPSGLLPSTNKQEEGQRVLQSGGQLNKQIGSSMVDRLTNPVLGAPDINLLTNLYTIERKHKQDEVIKLGVGDLHIIHPPLIKDNN